MKSDSFGKYVEILGNLEVFKIRCEEPVYIIDGIPAFAREALKVSKYICSKKNASARLWRTQSALQDFNRLVDPREIFWLLHQLFTLLSRN